MSSAETTHQLLEFPRRAFGEELCRKYALTSLKVGQNGAGLLAIDETIEACAQIADVLRAPHVADQIRQLKSCREQSARSAL